MQKAPTCIDILVSFFSLILAALDSRGEQWEGSEAELI